MSDRLKGKVAIITGGGGGIGAATGELFCAQGARVALVDRDRAALGQTREGICSRVPGARVETFVCDVSDAGQAAEVVSQTVGRLGALDILVNNAAIRLLGPVASADTAGWSQLLSVNLLGAVTFARASLPELRRSGKASLINVSSCYAEKGRENFGAYDASKAALLSLTRTLASEEARHGVRVNAVCPGGTLTPFTVGRHAARGVSVESLRQMGKPDTLLGRWAEASEIAYPILWLASDEASFVTGASLMVDGGCSAL